MSQIDDDSDEGVHLVHVALARPHHLTFDVTDFDAAATAGHEAVLVSRSDDWCEAFLHPKQGHGIVIQLAHHPGDHDEPGSLRRAAPVDDCLYNMAAEHNLGSRLILGPRFDGDDRW